MNIYKILGVLLIAIMISGCTSGSPSPTTYTPVKIKGKYYMPYEVNLKGQEVQLVKGMTYKCQGLKEAKGFTLVVEISEDKKTLNAKGYRDNKQIARGIFTSNKQGRHESYNKETGKTEYLLPQGGKNASQIVFTDNILIKKKQGITFQCKLASDYKIKKYAPMSDKQVQKYLNKQKKSSYQPYQSRSSTRKLNEQLNQMNSSIQPIQYSNTFGTSNRKSSNRSSSSTLYESTSGNKYKYDLSKPSDSTEYFYDQNAQLHDSVNPSVQMDSNMGQYGGGFQ